MKLLLDTHAFIWWDSDPARLSALAALRRRRPPVRIAALRQEADP
jgi:PIN domain nuclease of toxin-antitoxin system